MGISALTIALMYGSSETFRDVLARGSSLKRENRALEKANIDAASRISLLKAGVARAESEKDVAERTRADAQTRKAEAEKRASDARISLTQAESQLREERVRLGGVSQSLNDARKRVGEARQRLEAATVEKRHADASARTAETRTADARRALTAARDRIARAGRTFTEVTHFQSEKLTAQRRELARETTRYFQQEARLTEQAKQLARRETELIEQTRLAERQKTEVTRLTDELQGLERKRIESQKSLVALVSSTQALRDTRITYRVGEELARITLAPGASIWKVQNNLEGLLTAGAKKAEARGAKRPAEEAGSRAALIPTRVADGGQSVAESDAIREASVSIRGANQEVVVVLVAASNAVLGEPVPADLRILRNPVVLKAGATLGERELPNTRSRQDTADRLYAFLSQDIRAALLDAGVIPPTLGDAGETSIATLTGDEWLSLLESTRQVGSRVRVVVKVAHDLRAADPVRLTFEVKPLPPNPPTERRL